MANQITHVALLEKVFGDYFDFRDKRDILVGTLFPDIRYLGGISREQTHVALPTLTMVQNAPSAFEAGRIFHCLVDEVRERFMLQHGVYDLCPQSKYVTQSLKCFEDERYYHHVSDWKTIVAMYQLPSPDENVPTLPNDHLERWHRSLCGYMTDKPSDDSRSVFVQDIGFNADVAVEINEVVGVLRTKKGIMKIVDDFWIAFPKNLRTHA